MKPLFILLLTTASIFSMDIGIKGSSNPFHYYNTGYFSYNDHVSTLGVRLKVAKKYSTDIDLGVSVAKKEIDDESMYFSSFVTILSYNYPIILKRKFTLNYTVGYQLRIYKEFAFSLDDNSSYVNLNHGLKMGLMPEVFINDHFSIFTEIGASAIYIPFKKEIDNSSTAFDPDNDVYPLKRITINDVFFGTYAFNLGIVLYI